MFCSQCGTAISDDAKFCHKCGKSVSSDERRNSVTPNVGGEGQSDAEANVAIAAASTTPQLVKPLAPTKRQIAVSVLLVIFLALMYGFAISDALDGTFKAEKNTGGFVSLTALAFWHFWRSMNRNGWIGVFVGAGVSLLLLYMCSGIAAYVKGHP